MTGRPRMGTAPRVRVQVIMDPQLLAALDAALDGRPRSQAIEAAVREWLAAVAPQPPRRRATRPIFAA